MRDLNSYYLGFDNGPYVTHKNNVGSAVPLVLEAEGNATKGWLVAMPLRKVIRDW